MSLLKGQLLNQWAMDFDCCLKHIKESISKTKQAGAVIRLNPELEITGYVCKDHFLELDTVTHAWECFKEILPVIRQMGLLCSLGMPIIKGLERYNCQGSYQLVDFQLPIEISKAINQDSVPFGYGFIQFLDIKKITYVS